MNISGFFIQRPRFAVVLSVVIFLAGLVCMTGLPAAEYPDVVPPTVVVSTSFPGADPTVIAETVGTPLEQAINGVEGVLYQSSQATADGSYSLTVTFALGTDGDKDQVLVQNRVQAVLARLPAEVQKFGVTTNKTSPTLVEVIHLTSDRPQYDALYMSSYVDLHIKDELSRLYGVGDVHIVGEGAYAMRVWLNPDALAARSLTAGDVVKALREQNLEVAAGQLGSEPSPDAGRTQLFVTAVGRLETAEQFGNIILKAGDTGQLVHLRDVARVELGSSNYALSAGLDAKPAVSIAIYQRPGTNALQMADGVSKRMAELSKNFPPGIQHHIVYDTTGFVRESINAVIHTLFEAVLLVVLVVILFLQSWRASVIPLIAVPISLVGTFVAISGFGFGLNALTLFGLVLAIGIVVDDAIVVVENVERNIETGLSPRDATVKAMREVTGPIISTALVLCAVFGPTAFISGLTGQFYRQFALTIAVSTLISAFNSLTLSPALAAILLKPKGAPRDRLERAIDRYLGWLFRPFNRFFEWMSRSYVGGASRLIGRSGRSLIVYAVLIGLCGFVFYKTPAGFVPQLDKGYLVGVVQLPDAATLSRTEKVVDQMAQIGLKTPGVAHTIQMPGTSINGFSRSQNSAIVFFPLKPFEERGSKDLTATAISAALTKKFASITDATINVFPPPPVPGLGTLGGFKMQIEDQAGLGFGPMNDALHRILADGKKDPRLKRLLSTYVVNVPKIHADIDREKAKAQGVTISDIFDTLQVYLGSVYVNDMNRFGRTYQVFAQADQNFRMNPEDIGRLQVRNAAGQMIPIGAFITLSDANGPDKVSHYNSQLTFEINGTPGDGYSSGQAKAALEGIVQHDLPQGASFDWTDLTYQQIIAGNTAIYIFPLCVLLAFLVLVAQYESWTLPLVVILIVPMTLLCALLGVELTHGDNNVFTQIGLIVLVGLACKNAILIVEFAKDKEAEGEDILHAVLEACRLRLRPILMTSMAFILGVAPLAFSHGAGAEMRQAIGITVFFGMLGVTLFGLALTPVFYWVIRTLVKRRTEKKEARIQQAGDTPVGETA